MKMLTKSTLVLTLYFVTTWSPAHPTTDTAFYKIIIEDYYGASGHTTTHIVTRDSLKIATDCDFVGCEEKVIYKQALTDDVSFRFSEFISQGRIDTLRDKYETGGLDGLVRLVTIQRDLKRSKYILLERFHHPIVDHLVIKIKNLISDEKFRKMM